jgi:hypothetical protein
MAIYSVSVCENKRTVQVTASGKQGPPGPPGPAGLVGYEIAIDPATLTEGSLLQYRSSKFINVDQEHITDGGNF